MNTCSSSYYYIDNILVKTISEKLNEKKISEMTLKGEQQGYKFSFTSGNHFIILAKNINDQAVLIIHSSDRGYKIGNEALYPTQKSWFSNLLKRYVDPQSGRYLDYLIGEPALKFQEIALKNNSKNNDIHSWIASYLCDSKISGSTCHHYGMPKENAVQIGTYLIEHQEVVPIFSHLGYPVILFKSIPNMWGIKINDKLIIYYTSWMGTKN